MKVGIISDIHGDIDGLHKAFDLLEQQAADHIICVGDLIDRGPDGDAVVKFIRERNIPCVQGNHDALAHSTQSFFARHPELSFPLMRLRADTLAYLSSLPPELTFEWEGRTVYVTHANPWQDATLYIYPISPYIRFFDVVAAAGADIVILGHTHTPMAVSIADTLILNPGSVYANRSMEARTCAMLTLPSGDFDLFDVESGEPIPLGVMTL